MRKYVSCCTRNSLGNLDFFCSFLLRARSLMTITGHVVTVAALGTLLYFTTVVLTRYTTMAQVCHFLALLNQVRTSCLVSYLIFDAFHVVLLYVEKGKGKQRTENRFRYASSVFKKIALAHSLDDRRVFIAMEKKMTLLCVILSTHVHSDAVFGFFWSIYSCRLYFCNFCVKNFLRLEN